MPIKLHNCAGSFTSFSITTYIVLLLLEVVAMTPETRLRRVLHLNDDNVGHTHFLALKIHAKARAMYASRVSGYVSASILAFSYKTKVRI